MNIILETVEYTKFSAVFVEIQAYIAVSADRSGRSLAGIAGSNPAAQGYLFVVSAVCQVAFCASRGVLPNAVRPCV